MIIFFDTETTSLTPGRIIQLSYIMKDGEKTSAKNFFFGVEYIEPTATAVHGFTVDRIAELSAGKTFSWAADEIYDDFANADLIVGHNVKFDINFMIAEFGYIDRRFRYNEEFDTMKYFTPIMKMPRSSHRGYKYPKLSELCEYLDVYPYDVTRGTQAYYGEAGVSSHDARYDTVAMALCIEAGSKKFKELEETMSKHLQKRSEM
ncbi:MAG: 3'-5' exonuclease [Clostridia bacterium]|nr:3'-5' exonuclease [Clostridia bacterium]